MILGTNIQIPGIRGAQDLDYTLQESDQPRRVKVYLVPKTISTDQYYISITMPGGAESVPPCRGKDTLLLADYHLSDIGEATVNYINEEIENA
jgi:hypothetical protein